MVSPKVGFLLVLFLTVLPGFLGACIFGYAALIDWAALKAAYAHYELIVGKSDLQALFIAESQQNIYRINLFADGVWTLLSSILGAIGLVGICRRSRDAGDRTGCS
jgi:hypothetical protein